MIRFWNITPVSLHWRARKKLSLIDKMHEAILEYSKMDIRIIMDADYAIVFDATHNRMLVSCEVTFNLDKLIMALENVKEFFYYYRNMDSIIHKPNLYNRYIHLKSIYYGQKN